MIDARLTESAIDVDALLAETLDDRFGAQLLFLGVVRNHHQGRAVTSIDYEAYPPMALKELRKIAEDVAGKHEIESMLVVHRFGHHRVGDASLAVIASSAHRKRTFAAMEDVVDRIKRDVPIWKKEFFADGTVEWVLADKLVRSESQAN